MLKQYKVGVTNLVYQKTEIILNKEGRQLKRFKICCTLQLLFPSLKTDNMYLGNPMS
jgi:hypothetical protein